MVDDRPAKIRWEYLGILASIGWSLAYQYYVRIDCIAVGPRLQLHNEILAGTAPSPYRYRVLVPFLMEQFRKVLSHIAAPGQEFMLTYRVYEVVAMCFSLIVLFLYFRSLFSEDRAFIGALIAAGTMSLTFQDHYFQPWSLIEPGILALGLLLVRKDKRLGLSLLIPIAALNRETALMIPVAYAATHLVAEWDQTDYGSKIQVLVRSLAYSLEWLAVFCGLRYLRGSAPQIDSLSYLWATNTQPWNLSVSAERVALFLGLIWVLAILGYFESPPFVKATALVAPIYLALTFTFALWWEVRLLMPLYAIVIPLCLSYIFRDQPVSQQQQAGPGAEPILQPFSEPNQEALGPSNSPPSRRERKRRR